MDNVGDGDGDCQGSGDDDCQGSDQNGQVLSQRRHKIGDVNVKGLWILVQKLVDFERVNECIVVCIILHNTFMTFDYTAWEGEDEELINKETKVVFGDRMHRPNVLLYCM